jgi:hypothetical protein
MGFPFVALACLLLTMGALAQEKAQEKGQQNKPSAAQSPEAVSAEARSRKIWEDFKKRDKAALSATLAEGFRALEEGANVADAKEYLSTVDDFELKSYDLGDYTVTPLGREAVLINYHSHYEGTSAGETTQGNSGFSEVWVRRDGKWKIQYLQETYVK